jgi:hypothetical protein
MEESVQRCLTWDPFSNANADQRFPSLFSLKREVCDRTRDFAAVQGKCVGCLHS